MPNAIKAAACHLSRYDCIKHSAFFMLITFSLPPSTFDLQQSGFSFMLSAI